MRSLSPADAQQGAVRRPAPYPQGMTCGGARQVRSAVPMYLLSRKIKAGGFKVVLSGEGADEIYGGYLFFHKAPSPRALHECAPPPPARLPPACPGAGRPDARPPACLSRRRSA